MSVDVHTVHPYIGMIIAPTDYMPFLGTLAQVYDNMGNLVWKV